MGRVLTARDRRLGRDVALKEVAVHASHRRDAAARLAREAWITARLDHPAIVPVHDAGINDDGPLFYTMRLIRGETLADAMKGRQDLRSRLGLLRHFQDVCEAVAYAHAQGVVHRDPEPTLTRLTAAAGMVSVAPSHDGRRIYVGTHGALRVHDGITGELLASWPTDGLVLLDVVASPDGRWVAAGTFTGQVLVWSTADGVLRMVARAHEDRVVSVDFDQTRQVLVSGSWDGTALRWGLGPLDADPAVLVTQVESAWGMPLEDALAAELR
jgi:hypothetical protein